MFRVRTLLATVFLSLLSFLTSARQATPPPAGASRGCAAISDSHAVAPKSDSFIDNDIYKLVDIDTNFIRETWAMNIDIGYSENLKNALASWVPGDNKGIITLGLPFLRDLYNTGAGFAVAEGLRAQSARAAVRAVLYHEYAHLVQFGVIKDERYRDHTNSKWLELEADAMGAALLKAFLYWEESQMVAAISTYFSLGGNDFNAIDPHGYPYEREKYASLGMSYIEPLHVGALPFAKLHAELFGKDVRPYIGAATSGDPYKVAAAQLDDVIQALRLESGPKFAQSAKGGIALLLTPGDQVLPVSLHSIGLTQGFAWDDPIGAAFQNAYAARARLLTNLREGGDSPDVEWRRDAGLQLEVAQSSLLVAKILGNAVRLGDQIPAARDAATRIGRKRLTDAGVSALAEAEEELREGILALEEAKHKATLLEFESALLLAQSANRHLLASKVAFGVVPDRQKAEGRIASVAWTITSGGQDKEDEGYWLIRIGDHVERVGCGEKWLNERRSGGFSPHVSIQDTVAISVGVGDCAGEKNVRASAAFDLRIGFVDDAGNRWSQSYISGMRMYSTDHKGGNATDENVIARVNRYDFP